MAKQRVVVLSNYGRDSSSDANNFTRQIEVAYGQAEFAKNGRRSTWTEAGIERLHCRGIDIFQATSSAGELWLSLNAPEGSWKDFSWLDYRVPGTMTSRRAFLLAPIVGLIFLGLPGGLFYLFWTHPEYLNYLRLLAIGALALFLLTLIGMCFLGFTGIYRWFAGPLKDDKYYDENTPYYM